MAEENKDIGLYERIAVLEKQFEIVVPELRNNQKQILNILDNGLKEQLRELKIAFEQHCEKSQIKDEKAEKKRNFWLVGIRSIMVTSATSLLGLFAMLIWFVMTGRLEKFVSIIDKLTP